MGTINYNTDLTTGIYKKTSIKLTPEGLAYYNGTNLGGNQTVSYTMFKSPVSINESGKGKIDFEYNSHLSRTKMVYDNGLLVSGTTKVQRKSKYLTDDGSTEVLFDIVTHTIKIRTFVGGDAYSAVLYQEKQLDQNTNVTTTSNYYLHRDYLGSILAISNEQGGAVEKRAFDAWGNLSKLVDATGTSWDVTGGLRFFDRGYTSHEHLQEVGLIHMNGRLYDPVLRCFLMPDNFIQQPENTQNYNRYAYCLNNPLLYTDPSGEFIPFLAAVAIGAGIAALTYTLTALLADVPFSVSGLLKTTFIGAASAAVTFGIGSAGSCMFSLPAQGFWQGAAQGALIGGITGVFGTIANAEISGTNLTLKAVLQGGLIGAVVGGVIGGIDGGLRAQKNGADFWSGSGVSTSTESLPITGNEQSVEYSNQSAQSFSDNHIELNRLSKNVDHLYADGSYPSGFGFTSKDGIIYDTQGKAVFGTTQTRNTGFLGLGKREISVFLSKNAFVSRPQLYMTMNHEYAHAYFYYNNIVLPNDGHTIIHGMEYDQAKIWGIPTNIRPSYFSQSYNSTFNLYSKYGFKTINYIP